jgi:hypothetical protein
MSPVSPKATHIVIAVCAVLCALIWLWPVPEHRPLTPAPSPPPAAQKTKFRNKLALLPLAPEQFVAVELPRAIERGMVSADFEGNGRERMTVRVESKDSKSLRLGLAAGQILAGGRNRVVVLRPATLDLRAGESKRLEVQTAATTIMNQVGDGPYQIVPEIQLRLGSLLTYVENHPEVSQAAAQTAVLAVTENQTVRAFAKFAQLGGNLKSQFENSAFKVDVVDIVGALMVLREIGVPDQELALTIDPQLKIEAMIDPLAHALAMRYYGIKPDAEWSYWKGELLHGDMSTRHYALYGIAHYFPQIALQMLPGWARERRTSVVYRTSAVQALAQTRLPEALPALRQIEFELGANSDVGRSAAQAADFLARELNKPVVSNAPVGFRASRMISKL